MLNDNYSHDYYAKQMHVIKKWALNLGAVYLALFIIVDLYRYSGISLQQALYARVVFMLIPMVVVLAVFYNTRRLNISSNQFEWLSMATIIAVGVGHAKIIEIGANNEMFFPRIGLTIVLIYSGLLLALSIRKATLSSAIIVAIASYTYYSTGMPSGEIASLVFFYTVFSSCCIFMNHVFKKILNANYSLIKVIDQQANSDYLTKLFNRRYFYVQSVKIYQQAIREKKPLALLLIDLDAFKAINDEKGHKFGDSVLVKVGQVLQLHCRRPLDIAARLGGDEFVILLHDTNMEHIEEVCNNIIDDISRIAEEIRNNNRSLNLGVSIGVACRFSESRFNIKTLMDMADKALYHVKQHGKNNYCIKFHKQKLVLPGKKIDHLKLI